MIRYFPIWRETNVQFRAEYFDVLNHTELSNPSLSNPISSSTSFGTITQGGPRIPQFALKYVFRNFLALNNYVGLQKAEV